MNANYPSIPFARKSRLAGLGLQYTATSDDIIFGEPEFASFATRNAAEAIAPTPPANQVNVVKASAQDSKQLVNSIAEFSDWLRVKYPDIYKAAMMSRPDLLIPEFAMAGLGGLRLRQLAGLADAAGDSAPSSEWGKQISDLLNKIAAPLLNVYQQKKILDINVKRAEMGLDPINESNIAPTVNVGVPPQQMEQIMSLGKIMVIGVLGLGAVYLVSKKRR